MKYSTYIGIGASVVLIIACFLPWAYYPDLDKIFNGFFSEKNQYGRPGKAILFFSIISIVLFLIPRVWAKRLNQFVGVLTFAYCIKTYVLFASCYHGICPEKKEGLYLLMISSVIMLIAALLPDMKLKETR